MFSEMIICFYFKSEHLENQGEIFQFLYAAAGHRVAVVIAWPCVNLVVISDGVIRPLDVLFKKLLKGHLQRNRSSLPFQQPGIV